MAVEALVPIALGLLVGGVSAVPPVVMLGRLRRGGTLPGMGAVVGSALLPFVALQLLMLAAAFAWPQGAVSFGTTAALCFLAAVAAAGVRSSGP